MRVFPRIARPALRARRRRLSLFGRRRLSLARLFFVCEAALYGGALVFLLTGSRAVYLERLHARTAALVILSFVLAAALVHLFIRRHVLPRVERRFSPPAYDDRRILLDLSEAARAATNTDELYNYVVEMIRGALGSANVSLFVHEGAAGRFACRASAEAGAPFRRENSEAQLDANSEAQTSASEQDEAATLSLPHDAFVVNRLRNLAIPLHIEPQDLETWVRALDGASDALQAARIAECSTLRRLQSSLMLQIKMKEQLVGILSVGRRQTGRAFSPQDEQLLMSVAGQLALVIENSKLVERMAEEERLRRELALAAEVQQRLFPSHPPSSETLELSGLCQPARGVGGDYYDFLSLDNGQTGITVADVAGKGISAALLMSIVQATLRSQAMAHCTNVSVAGSLSNLVSVMNRLLCRSTGIASYVTFFYAQFDAREGKLTYVNAGHNPPFLIRKRESTGADEEAAVNDYLKLATGGAVIGVFEHFGYEEETLDMQSGDLLFAYTDGVTEALNLAGEEYGEERLLLELVAATNYTAEEIRDRVVGRLREWCAGARQHDDLTLVVLKVK
ncbi:MAG TPA: PP2C family protein-serine/threonine phosphatase [Pyrinomonadaceae bacterium]|nr:PP2C family protein-serine/threonine phosphatase [Pyrinomonadaceae bacterium]